MSLQQLFDSQGDSTAPQVKPQLSDVKFSQAGASLGGTAPVLPLVVSPRIHDSKAFLTSWLVANRVHIHNRLLDHGAILLKGFDLQSAQDLQDTIVAFQPKLSDVYRGTSPRSALDGTKYVFSAAEVPTHYPIAQHLEMSFLPCPPKQLFFGCLVPSKQIGGETALCHFGSVARDLPAPLRAKFIEHGVRYIRTHPKQGNPWSFDVSEMLGWPELFKTNDKKEVERICKEEKTPVNWTNDDTFVSTTVAPAFQRHPETGEVVWCNHTQVFHWTTFSAELWFAFRRTHEIRLLGTLVLVFLWSVIKYGILGYKMSLHCEFGNGEQISIAEISAVRNAIHKNMVFFRWEKGDLLLLDNCSTSHGRQPTYDKGRRIAVSWCTAVWNKGNEIRFVEDFLLTPKSMENPQERTPEPTLTQSDAKDLANAVSLELLNKRLDSVKVD